MSSPIRDIFTNIVSKFKSRFNKPDNISGFVIDTSICGIDNPKALFEELISSIDGTNRKIILTNVTIDELDKLQKRSVENSENARAILTAASNDKEHSHYLSVKIDTSFELADDCILNFCEIHKDSVVLLTADKAMYLKAQAMSIETHFYKSHWQPKVKSNLLTLYPTERDCEKLLLTTNFNSFFTAFRVRSKGIEYDVSKSTGPKELHVGDDVLIAKNKGNYILLSHFRVVSLYESDNCELVYKKRIYSSQDVNQLDAFYKSFIKDFKHSRNIK